MTFAHLGLAAAGLAAVAIPIIIHLLFRRRRRPVPWAAMRFILEALKKQRRKLRLEQFLLLLARCLLVALAGAAIARPLLEKAGMLGSGGRDVYFVVDNSVASAVRGADGQIALDRIKTAAADMVAALGPGDRAGLITLSMPAEASVVPASADVSEVGRIISELTPTDARADVAGALERLGSRVGADAEGKNREREVVAVVLSEFRSGTADISRALPEGIEGLVDVRIVALDPVTAGVGNVQVVGVEPVRGVVVTGEGQGAERIDVRVRLRRTGPAVGETGVTTVRVREIGSGSGSVGAGGEGVVRWEAGQADADAVVSLEVVRDAAWGEDIVLRAEIDRDALDADNTVSRVVGLRERLAVGVIGADAGARKRGLGPADWVRLALAPADQTTVSVETIEPTRIDLPVVSRMDAVFVVSPDLVSGAGWATLGAFADRGGLVVVTPPENAATHVWADAMAAGLGVDVRMAREATDDGADGIGLATEASGMLGVVGSEFERLAQRVRVQKHVAFEMTPERAKPVVRLDSGAPWIVALERTPKRAPGAPEGSAPPEARGTVVVFGSALAVEWTDLPARPLMVPLLQEIVREGVGRASASSTVAAGVPAPVAPDVDSATLDGGFDVLSGTPANPYALSRRSGVARLRDEAGRSMGMVAINTDADGARTDIVDADAVRRWLGDVRTGADDAEPGSSSPRSAVEWVEGSAPAQFLSRADRGSPISLPLLIAALVVAVMELCMARWFSHAMVTPAKGRAASAIPEGAAA